MLEIVAAIFAVLGSAVGAYSAIRQGQTAEATARFNARMAEQEAESARQAAAINAETRRRELERIFGTQRAQVGASGVIGSEGSPLLLLMQSEEEAALDVARIRHGGAIQAFGLEQEARLTRFRGRQARRLGFLEATGAILRGVAGATMLLKKPAPPSTPAPSTPAPSTPDSPTPVSP